MRSRHLCVSTVIVWLGIQCFAAVGEGALWNVVAEKPDAWYRGDEGKAVTRNILSHQTRHGSWPKNMDTAAEPYGGDPGSLQGTFDNGACRGELRFLASAYRATGDEKTLAAFLRGLDHILEAQYDNGGWPQTYPPGRGYNRHITFNDGTMIGLMGLLREVAESEDYEFVDAKRRELAGRAFDKGVGCILRCQVVVKGQPTVWCAQHDADSLEPRQARSYEHISLSGGESTGIILLLMSLEDPKPEVVRAVEAACRWYEQAQLRGIRRIRKDGDTVIVADPEAPPLWARFYEIGTNRPIFSGRDGVIKYTMAEIEHERRNGYSWYGDSGRVVLDQWPKWRRTHGLPVDPPK